VRSLMHVFVRCFWLACALAVSPVHDTTAASAFYKGKSVTFIIGSAAGGGYDTYSRLLASHIGRHIDGQPQVIPQNMPGAGSIRAANYLYNAARKDGTVIGMLDEAIYLNQILGTRELKVDAVKFNWIGRILPNSAILFARRDASVQKIEDVFSKELIVSTSGAASKLNWTVLNKTLGMKFTLISGYPGTNESLLAMTRGEVDALSMPWSILRVRGAQLIHDGEIKLLLQTGTEKETDLARVPRMIDLARNEDERRLLELFSSPSLIGRSIVAPPGLQPERVAELRRAFSATMQDAKFLADLKRAGLEISPMTGEQLQAAVVRAGQFPPALIERARRAADVTN
jgi:tripartite-type tricarboxylate transporter receptor subunit TctC